MPLEVQKSLGNLQTLLFGPAGLLEQDDGENWSQATLQTYGVASRQVKQVVNIGLGRGKVIKEHGLARIPLEDYLRESLAHTHLDAAALAPPAPETSSVANRLSWVLLAVRGLPDGMAAGFRWPGGAGCARHSQPRYGIVAVIAALRSPYVCTAPGEFHAIRWLGLFCPDWCTGDGKDRRIR